MMARNFILMAICLGFFGIAIGAFGAHGLESTLTANDRMDTFETAARYQMYHVFALMAVAWIYTQYPGKWVIRGGYLIFVGTLIFSGSLYILAIADFGFMGAIAPIGGTALLAGWGCLGYAAWQAKGNLDQTKQHIQS